MGILGIPNRTENWKTADSFVPLSAEARVRLVDRLLDTPTELQPGTVRMELFWRGLRDHFAQCKRLSQPSRRPLPNATPTISAICVGGSKSSWASGDSDL